MIDNTIVAGGAAEAPEISVAPTGLITATAGGKTSTLQQQTGEFYYYPTGDAFHTASPAYLAAQGFFPSKEAVVVERVFDRTLSSSNIALTTHIFPSPSGQHEQQCVVIPLSAPVYGGKNGIVSFSVGLKGIGLSGISTAACMIGPFSNYIGLAVDSVANFQVYFDVSGKTLYVGTILQSLDTSALVNYCVVYRKA